MRIKLSYKLFTAFVLMSFIVVALTAISYRYLMARNFWNFVNQTVLTRMDNFSQSLVAEYEIHQGWRHLKDDRERWFALMAETFLRWNSILRRLGHPIHRKTPSMGPLRKRISITNQWTNRHQPMPIAFLNDL